MATSPLKQKILKKTARKSCFPACFGSSGSVLKLEIEKRPCKKDVESGRKMYWFSFLKSRKKRSGRKTVPVDLTATTQEQDPDEEIKEVLEETPEISGRPAAKPAKVPGVGESEQAVSMKTRKGIFANCVSQQPESLTPSNELGEKPVIRKTRTSKSGSQPGSPETRTTRAMINSCSASPPPSHRKTVYPPGNSRLSARNSDPETVTLTGEFNPIVGLSILVITLAMMLLWGRLCAIICTSAWFYFIPRLRTVINSGTVAGKANNTDKLDMDSSEYKKKVIMDGLLERTRRNYVGSS